MPIDPVTGQYYEDVAHDTSYLNKRIEELEMRVEDLEEVLWELLPKEVKANLRYIA